MHTFLDFDFLRTLPEGQIRNGFAEIVKISHVADKTTWDLLVKYGPDLVKTGFGRKEADAAYSKELKEAADVICRRAIKVMLDLESPNLHEIGLDRGEHAKCQYAISKHFLTDLYPRTYSYCLWPRHLPDSRARPLPSSPSRPRHYRRHGILRNSRTLSRRHQRG